MTSNGERRPSGDANLGSAPFNLPALETPAAAGSKLIEAQARAPGLSLQFNPTDFLRYVEDEGLTEAEATALLRAIWDIVVAFVDLGFGLNPVQQALVDRSRMNAETLSPRVPDRVSSKEEFSKIANNKPAGRFYPGSAMPEES